MTALTRKPSKPRKPRKCRNPACGREYIPDRSFQIACDMRCALALVPIQRAKQQKKDGIKERAKQRAARAKIKSRGDYLREAQQAFNAWVRERDAEQPCISCGRHHQGKYDAGHYRSVGSNPALRFEPLNCHKQCVPCNQHKSGNAIEYRIGLVARVGAETVAWLEEPHEPKRYSIDDLKAIKAKYKALTRELQQGRA